MSFRNAIAVATDQSTEIRAVGQIVFQRVIAQHHVAKVSILVRHRQRLHNAAISHDARGHAVGVAQGVNLHRRPIGG
jgi:hypothetical protein